MANVDARVHTDAAEWPGLLSAQLCSPVRWRQSLEALSGRGATLIVELGPGRRADRHGARATPDVRGVPVAVPDDLDKLMDTLSGGDEWSARARPTRASTSTPPSGSWSARPPASSSPTPHLAALESTALAEATAAPGQRRGRRARFAPGGGRPGRHRGPDRRPHAVRRDPGPLAGRAGRAGGRGPARGLDPDQGWRDRDRRDRHDRSDSRPRTDMVSGPEDDRGPGGPGHRRLPWHRPGLRRVVPGQGRPGGHHLADRGRRARRSAPGRTASCR